MRNIEHDGTYLVSVIMPAHNEELYIAEAIQSVIDQTYKNWELLIINDGSTDETGQRVRQFPDTRIRYYPLQKGGVSKARNKGLQEMKGMYFCFLDADDRMPPRSIEARLAVMSDVTIMFADGCVEVFNETLDHLIRTWTPQFSGYPFNKLVHLSPSCFFGLTWLVRVKSDVVYHFEEDMTHAEDLFFYMRLSGNGKYSFTDECVWQYRVNADSAMHNLDGLAEGYSKLIKKMSEEFSTQLTFVDRCFLQYKTRKIMFLSYFAVREYKKAFRFLLAT